MADSSSSIVPPSSIPLPGADHRSTIRRAVAAHDAAATAAAAGANGGLSAMVLLVIEAPNGKTVKVETTPADCVLDIRSFLLECPETAEYTAYHLEFDGLPLHDLAELSIYPALCSGTLQTIKLIPDIYDERTIRLHIRRFRELLVKPPSHTMHSFLPAIDLAAYKKKEKKRLEKLGNKKNKDNKDNNNNNNNEEKNDDIEGELENNINGLLSSTDGTDSINLSALWEDSNNKKSSTIYSASAWRQSSPSTDDNIEPTIKNLIYSPWNPAPGNRRLRGDLVYLELTTLEDLTFFITGAVEGFFINSSTNSKFNPELNESAPYKSHTLLELLKKISPLFSSKFSRLLQRQRIIHPLSTMDIGMRGANDWMIPSPQHSYDWNKNEDAGLVSHGMDPRGITRDWNEEIQSCKELPSQSIQDRIIKDRTYYRIYCDFIDAATKGAMAIILGHIPPINPLENPRAHVFIYNNIFFSFAIDPIDNPAGGENNTDDYFIDRVTLSMANHDLQGINLLNTYEINDLYTIATCLIDYSGHRVIAQSIIPGIFHGDRVSKHVYGSMNRGETIESKESFHSLMVKAAEKLHLSEHSVLDSTNKSYLLASCMDSKGIVGSDGRSYILDLFRTTPRDANYSDWKQYSNALIRPELLNIYCRKLAVEKLKSLTDNKKDKKNNKDTATDDHDETYSKYLSSIRFNPDSYSHAKLGDTQDKINHDNKQLEEIGKFLKNDAIPKLVEGFRNLDYSPADTTSLCSLLHDHGINYRYLSSILLSAQQSNLPHIVTLCSIEIITRCAKHYFNLFLRSLSPDRNKKSDQYSPAPMMIKFLNNFLGTHCAGQGLTQEQLDAAHQVLLLQRQEKINKLNEEKETLALMNENQSQAASILSKKLKKEKKQEKKSQPIVIRLSDNSKAPIDPIAPVNLWQSIRELSKEKFNHSFDYSLSFIGPREKLMILRSFTQKTGIQLVCKDYNFNNNNGGDIFTLDDIIDIVPVIKSYPPRSFDGIELLESGKVYFQQGRLPLSYSCLMEALNIFSSVYGPLHRDTADCYTALALVCYHAGDIGQSVDYQQRAIIINERLLGVDHWETAHSHMAMALYLENYQQHSLAIAHCRRALLLFEVISGPNSADVAAAHMNLAMLYQNEGNQKLSLDHLLIALKKNIAALGENHLQVAINYHSVAIGYYLSSQYRQALDAEKQSKAIFINILGGSHQRVQQANQWLNTFTTAAVQAEKDGNNNNANGAMNALRSLQSSLSSSLFSWISLRSSSYSSNNTAAIRSRLTLNDVLKLVEQSAIRQNNNNNNNTATNNNNNAGATIPNPSPSSQAAEEEEDDVDDNNPSSSSLSQKAKRRQKRLKQKEKKQKAAAATTEETKNDTTTATTNNNPSS